MNEWISYGGDCRTAPATPGLLISITIMSVHLYGAQRRNIMFGLGKTKMSTDLKSVRNSNIFNIVINADINLNVENEK